MTFLSRSYLAIVVALMLSTNLSGMSISTAIIRSIPKRLVKAQDNAKFQNLELETSVIRLKKYLRARINNSSAIEEKISPIISAAEKRMDTDTEERIRQFFASASDPFNWRRSKFDTGFKYVFREMANANLACRVYKELNHSEGEELIKKLREKFTQEDLEAMYLDETQKLAENALAVLPTSSNRE